MAQSAQGLGFDLAYPLAGHAHLAADFFQSVTLPVMQAVAQL
jgi:hypothetical protein